MKGTSNKSTTALVSLMAEKLLKKKPTEIGSRYSEAEGLKLIQEIELYQSDLEIQNEKLKIAIEKAEKATEKYVELFEYAPTGYFTLNHEGAIVNINLCGSQLLGKECRHLVNTKFDYFISDDTKPIFKFFLRNVFDTKVKVTCEVTLICEGNLPMYAHIDGIVSKNGEQCLMTLVDITMRKQAEKALRESEERFRQLVETSPDAITLTDLEGKIMMCNHQTVALHGFESTQAMLGINALELFPPEERQRALENMQKTLTDGLIKDIEYTLLRKDGSCFPAELSAALIHSEDGTPRFFMAITQNITRRKQAEELLYNERTLFRTIIDLIPDAIYVKDIEGRKILANPKEIQLSRKKSEDETIGKTDFNLYPDQDAKRSQKEDEFVLSTGKPILGIECIVIDIEGKLHSLLGSKVPLRDIHGNINGIVGINHDITELKNAVSALHDSEERYRTIVENMGEGIGFMDNDEQFVFVNRAAEEIFGVESGKLVGMNLHHFVNDEQLQVVKKETGLRIQGIKSVYELEIIRPNGEKRTIIITAVPHYNKIGTYGVFRDITERKWSEEVIKNTLSFQRALMDAVPSPIFYKDADCIYMGGNKAFERYIGLTPDQFIGKTVYDISPLDLAEKYAKADRELLNNPGIQTYENSVVYADGTRHDVIFNKATFTNVEGKVAGMIGVILDITDRKRAEVELRKSEERYRMLFERSNDAIFLVDKKSGKFLDVNKAAEKLTGFALADLKKLKTSDITLKDSKNILAKVGKRKSTMDLGEVEYLRPGKSKRTALLSIIPLSEDKVFQIARDITERKKLEYNLLILSRAVDQSPVSIVITDTNGVIEYINPKFSQVTGYSFEEVLGKTSNILKSGYTSNEEYANLWKTIKSGNEWSGEFCNRKKNGELYWESALISPIINEKGTIIHFVGVKEDITGYKETEQRIQSSIIEAEERERMYFSQELHDGLGPLLSATKMYVQWLGMPNAKLEHTEIIKDIERFLNESTRTVHEISFKLSPHILQNFGLVEAINAFAEKVKESSSIRFELNIENLNRFSKNVETIAYRVLCECINNTIKHASASKIVIDMRCQNDLLLVDYSDNGHGFDVDAVMSEHKGIGLLNIQSRIKSINGLIDINSTIGKGTIIKFQLKIQNS